MLNHFNFSSKLFRLFVVCIFKLSIFIFILSHSFVELNAKESIKKHEYIELNKILETWIKENHSHNDNIVPTINILLISEDLKLEKYMSSILGVVDLVTYFEITSKSNGRFAFIYYSISDIIVDSRINYEVLNLHSNFENEYFKQIVATNDKCFLHLAKHQDGKLSLITFDNIRMNTKEESIKCFLGSMLLLIQGNDALDTKFPANIGDFVLLLIEEANNLTKPN